MGKGDRAHAQRRSGKRLAAYGQAAIADAVPEPGRHQTQEGPPQGPFLARATD